MTQKKNEYTEALEKSLENLTTKYKILLDNMGTMREKLKDLQNTLSKTLSNILKN